MEKKREREERRGRVQKKKMGWHRQLALCYCCFFFTFLKALHGYDMYKLYNFVYDVNFLKIKSIKLNSIFLFYTHN